uniref:TOG domain-containing protein n=1 Tax=Globodera rostochiensis TaxID=31243 RepID=A0A914HYH9_GLORO
MLSKHPTNSVSGSQWDKCVENLANFDVNAYLNIDEREIKIFETPDGKLFNEELIDRNMELYDTKNVRRDPSYRTFKEQIEALEALNERAIKNREKGILSERQKQAVEKELKIEKEIRSRLKKLYDSFEEKIKSLFLACKKEQKNAYSHIDLFFDVVVPLLRSPLVSKTAVQGYLAYRNAFFEVTDDNLHKLIAQISLRVLRAYFIPDHWLETPLDEQLNQTFNVFSSACFLYSPLSDDELADSDLNKGTEETSEKDAIVEECPVTAAKLAFMVPFLEQIFLKVSPTFIKPAETVGLPMIKLARFFVDCLFVDTSIDYADVLFVSLSNFMEMLNENGTAERSIASTTALTDFLQHCLSKIKNPDAIKRLNILKILSLISTFLAKQFERDLSLKEHFRHGLFLAIHDPNDGCLKLAKALWDEFHFEISFALFEKVVSDLHDELDLIRDESARSVKSLLTKYPQKCEEALDLIGQRYNHLKKFQSPQFDNVGRLIRAELDPWVVRSGIANGLVFLAGCITSDEVMKLVRLVVSEGLSDRSEKCRDLMRVAATIAIQNHGASCVDELFPFLEGELSQMSVVGKKIGPEEIERNDNLRQGDDAKVRKIVARLIETLSTPSQQVQESVAACLPALMPSLRADAKPLMENMFLLLTNAEQYGERRGAAYGIAAIVKGLGVVMIKEMSVSVRLKELLAQKQNAHQRESALLCIEMFCGTLGKLFEPYLIHLLPNLLNMFNDSNESVRRAADDAARAMMRSLSAHGVKLLLPSLLKGLDDDSWRTKCASAELLGAMSNCAPRQLSTSLPSIVPKLSETLTDTHSKVQKTGERALKQIAKVIQNPECLAISSHLIQALVDPPGKTTSCLQTIVNNKFVHYVDSPSLALMMPIIYRAFEERNTEARRMAAQIISNIYQLVDSNDMEPYLGQLMPGLRKALLHPVPEVRTVAGKAIGAIVKYSAPETSEKIQADVMPWLKENLVSPTSSVDRQGAAQGLSEVISALGEEFLAENLPGVIRITESLATQPHIRDGYIQLYIYLPMAFGERFAPFLSQIIPSILKALSDETEYVRESALKAGKHLITASSVHARKLLIPQLQSALIHENWRIRQASVKLIGDFLFHVSGVSGKMTSETTGEDDTMGSEAVNKAIVRSIGQRSRDELMAGIYLTRYDVVLAVRQAASHVWKVVVANTPRTLRDMMRPLFELMLHCLSSSVVDQQQMAVRCLSELVKKMGERILEIVLPLLEDRLKRGGVNDRRGVALALNEIIGNVHREIVENHASCFVGSIRTCLSDPDTSVREAAGHAFAAYHAATSHLAVEQIVSPMFDTFNKTGEKFLLDGLCSVMAGPNGRQLFQSLLSKLARPPVNSSALCRLAMSTDALKRNLNKVMDAMLSEETNTSIEEHIQNCIPVMFTLDDEGDVRAMFSLLLKHSLKGKSALTASMLLKAYIEESDGMEYSESQLDTLFSGLVGLYNSENIKILHNAIDSLTALVKQLDQSSYVQLSLVLKRAIKGLASDTRELSLDGGCSRGLCVPTGWQPFLAILREALLVGGVEIKEVAANSLSQLIPMSNEVGLKPHVVNMAGPLIRILGERHPVPVKIAALNGLLRLLENAPLLLKAFLPQMQSVLIKILQDPASPNQRQLASQALAHLINLHPKPEAILKELNKMREAETTIEGLDFHSDKLINDLITQIGSKIEIVSK